MEFMVDKNTFLEHSSGKYWNVKVSMVDGFLAFHEGWSAFVSDNSLEVGEMIVFRYLGGSHFTVEIFDKTACEKPFTSKKKDDNKRKQKMTEPSSVDGSPHVPVGPLDDEKIVCKNSNENINSKRARLTKGSSHKSVEQAKSRVTTDGISKEENIEEIPTEEKSRCFESNLEEPRSGICNDKNVNKLAKTGFEEPQICVLQSGKMDKYAKATENFSCHDNGLKSSCQGSLEQEASRVVTYNGRINYEDVTKVLKKNETHSGYDDDGTQRAAATLKCSEAQNGSPVAHDVNVAFIDLTILDSNESESSAKHKNKGRNKGRTTSHYNYNPRRLRSASTLGATRNGDNNPCTSSLAIVKYPRKENILSDPVNKHGVEKTHATEANDTEIICDKQLVAVDKEAMVEEQSLENEGHQTVTNNDFYKEGTFIASDISGPKPVECLPHAEGKSILMNENKGERIYSTFSDSQSLDDEKPVEKQPIGSCDSYKRCQTSSTTEFPRDNRDENLIDSDVRWAESLLVEKEISENYMVGHGLMEDTLIVDGCNAEKVTAVQEGSSTLKEHIKDKKENQIETDKYAIENTTTLTGQNRSSVNDREIGVSLQTGSSGKATVVVDLTRSDAA
ncbi:hypothetical protein QJS10_CPA08g00460 [Acorus calamus]|uniref:TF-B3 domain-containing protein n=1 Tax=Acorus calamus TaxID=4465 RepID=A0AAV9EDB1_ACOCL|nr:hypothetical protein QJS10_CPA08g00460 [Acorus calamus]